MNLEELEHLDAEGLRGYIRSLLWQFRLVDAFWFLKTEEEHGLASAELLNERVWTKVGELGARDILQRFGPFAPGVEGFLAAYKLFPWSLMVDYRVERAGGDLIVSVPRCPAQEGRRKHGLGPYVCKHMHQAEFEAFARVIAPNVRVECLFAPPDEHPADCHCSWRFYEE
ncbi:MAG TPA: DUF6125 family protein [Desulfovibrio sp.]|jgi:hypothetical protein|uniref:DUF6125 family protein n=1 Tax=Desulfovibrio TaxID=872 RepID=UPI002A48FE21|nr:DUF6125 family protein [Desulfovibrio sp.]MDY0306264.1 DUF6125 family protein [Desulfovibrionaceae bacterium]HMM39194.1 DUF6125 family protein [Desulfovibrio sp.]